MSSQKARIAVIGTGWWATTTHIPALQANPGAEIVAICDKNATSLKKAADAYGPLKTYTDYQEMLAHEHPDGAIVVVNHAAHYEVTRACLEAGVNVMVEKPMVLFARHAYELERIARERNVELIIGYPWHYTELTRRARDIIQSGELGEIQYVSCLFSSTVIEFLRGNDEAYRSTFGYPVTGPGRVYSDPQLSGGGQGHLQVTHSAASMFFVTGLQADKVSCYMENWDVPVDLVNAISVRFKPTDHHPAVGVVGSTGNNRYGGGGYLDIQVACERGHLSLEQIQGILTVHGPDRMEQRYGPLPPPERPQSWSTAYNLVDVVLGRAENGSPAHIGTRTVELLDAAYRSAAAGGQPVNIADL